MSKTVLITYRVPKDGNRLYVSHGIDVDTLQNVVLSQDPLDYYISKCGAYLDPYEGEYVIEDKK